MHVHIQPKAFISGIFVGMIAIIVLFSGVLAAYNNKIVSGVYIQDIPVGGKTRAEAAATLATQLPSEWTVTVSGGEEALQFATSSATLGIAPDIELAAKQAFAVGRSSSFINNIIEFIASLAGKTTLPLPFTHDGRAVSQWTNEISSRIDLPGRIPRATLGRSGYTSTLTISPGKVGRSVDAETLNTMLLHISSAEDATIPFSVASTSAELTKEEIAAAYTRAGTLVGKTLILEGDADARVKIGDRDLISFLTLPEGYDENLIREKIATISAEVDRPPKNAAFEEKNGVVLKFVAPEQGRKLNTSSLTQDIIDGIKTLEKEKGVETTVALTIETTDPEVALKDTNNLGINERIGTAESLFFHSIPNRIYNVELTSKNLNNTLVPPGKEFSFNKAVGEVSAKTGYRQAYVISQGRTVLGDGGGVCQVSTTMFRAALNAGLPILERHGHSYRVGYYEQNEKPGIDATVYAPSVDLRIKNDTPGYLLITTEVWPNEYRMKIHIWGTSDGRVATVTDKKIWAQTPALPTVYQDDPTLPAGTLKQVDWAAPGAKTSFQYTVQRESEDGRLETLQDRVFSTTFQPWASVYLRGTATP